MVEGIKNHKGKLITFYGQDPARVTDLIERIRFQFFCQFPPAQWLTYHLEDANFPTGIHELSRSIAAPRLEIGVRRHLDYEPLLNASLGSGVNIIAENYVDKVIAEGGTRFHNPVGRMPDLNLLLGESSENLYKFLPRNSTRLISDRHPNQQIADALRFINQIMSQTDSLVVAHHQRRFHL